MFRYQIYLIFVLAFCSSIVSSEHLENSNILRRKDDDSIISKWVEKLIAGATDQIGKTIIYDPAYRKISYPNGDFSIERGVCTDVIIRAFRSIGVDLQKLIHEDMQENWSEYPNIWGMKKTDKNIDHRRVPNIARFFKRLGMQVKDDNFLPGDIVVWDLGGGVLHVGILDANKSWNTYLVIHNISSGVKKENILNSYNIVGKYRLNLQVLKKLKIIK